MKKRNDVKVTIGGKQYTMGGYESEEYFQNLAAYINMKIGELKRQGGYPKLDSDIANVLLQINIADDYFKLKRSQEDTSREYEDKQKENVELKREIIGLQAKLETYEQENRIMKEENLELQKRLIRMEAEVEELRRRQ
ncbi:MAG: cell division protein ZapA [Lachnospiraceae bacterium]|nr:cell division protein ZapA [Lachnospiraceae bacterium]MBP3608922.1 cell division protein ZapA [Lachnospiraceae bacterium]